MTKKKMVLVTVLVFVFLLSIPSNVRAEPASTTFFDMDCESVHFWGTVASGEWLWLQVRLHDSDTSSPVIQEDVIVLSTPGPFDVTVPWVSNPDARYHAIWIDYSDDGGQSWETIDWAEGYLDCPPDPGGEGCTRKAGYWKTHSKYGPANYDETWAEIDEDTPFFSSGYSWYEVTKIPPKGNPYFILSKQYVATQLNFLAGANPSDILSEFGQATTLLSTYSPNYDWKLDPDNVRVTFVNLAITLEDYNEGYIGPGICD